MVSYHFADVAVLIGYLITNNFSIQIGPEFGLLLKRAANKRSDRDTKKFDRGAAAGFAQRLNGKISIGARYVQGLIKVDEVAIAGMPPVTAFEIIDLGRNQAFHINLLMQIN